MKHWRLFSPSLIKTEDRAMLTPTEVVRLVEICLRSTRFQCNNIYYEQIEGTAMGSPLAPICIWSFLRN